MHNVPLKAGSGGREFREAVETVWLPLLHDFKPQILFISAGFDAHRETIWVHWAWWKLITSG